MPRLPLVAIIGRPNTGKSTLFNRLIGERRAIESEVPGTTRDHVASRIETDVCDFLLIDTGGMGGGTADKDFEKDVHGQSLLAVDAADIILFTINAKEELTGSDQEIVSILRKRKRKHVPVILAATKCDNDNIAEKVIPELLSLGITEEIIPVSATHNMGTEELLDAVTVHLKNLKFKKAKDANEANETNEAREIPRIAIVGKPNVGKSSIVNALMTDDQRKTSPRLVSPVAGTTRDTTDTVITRDGAEYILIDTAGLKRHAKTEPGIESYATLRSIQAIEQSDVVVVVIDATEKVSAQDKRIASLANEGGKGLILLLNKIDHVKGEERKAKMNEVVASLQFCRYAELLPASAVTREGLLKLFPLVEMVYRNRMRRIPDRELRQWFGDAIQGQPMGELQHSKHLTQAEGLPPTFVIFTRHPKKVQLSQLRYLENRLRETFGFEGSPVRWITKSSGRAER